MANSPGQPVSPSPPVIIRYTLTRSDLLRWQIYYVARQRLLNALILIMALSAAWLSLREPDMWARSLAFKIFFVVGFIIIFFGFVFAVQLLVLVLTILMRKHRGSLGEHVLEVRDDGILERTDVNESLHRWAGFHRMKTTRRYIYLYVTDVQVHVIPLRCFTSREQVAAFLQEIQRHTKKA